MTNTTDSLKDLSQNEDISRVSTNRVSRMVGHHLPEDNVSVVSDLPAEPDHDRKSGWMVNGWSEKQTGYFLSNEALKQSNLAVII